MFKQLVFFIKIDSLHRYKYSFLSIKRCTLYIGFAVKLCCVTVSQNSLLYIESFYDKDKDLMTIYPTGPSVCMASRRPTSHELTTVTCTTSFQDEC